ncbi:MAG: rhodanese-like domain-containing protein [Ignavibacteriaceae bacterium]
MIKNFSPVEIKEILDKEKNIRLVDVREEWEYQIVKLENSELMPLSNFGDHLSKLSPDEKIIVYCHHGTRSYAVCNYLIENGFKNVINLKGGINSWSEEVDNSIEVY